MQIDSEVNVQVSIRIAVRYCALVILAMFASHLQAENVKPIKKIPKWKQEHIARVANAAKVCASPTLNPKAKPKNLTTNFYQINLIPDGLQMYLDAQDGSPGIVSTTPQVRDWLLSRVGAGLYKISACVNEKPLCLTTTAEKAITLAACNEFGYGDQVWWLKGYVVGKNKGGWFLGNDGVGQMECLVADETQTNLVLETCTNEQNGWRFKHVNQKSVKKTINQRY